MVFRATYEFSWLRGNNISSRELRLKVELCICCLEEFVKAYFLELKKLKSSGGRKILVLDSRKHQGRWMVEDFYGCKEQCVGLVCKKEERE